MRASENNAAEGGAMTGQDWMEKDFYAVLGVSKSADANEIKKAFRKLARSLHPDHNPGNAKAEAKFKEVGEAYAVLSDPEQRKQYDQLRAMTGGARFSAGPGGAGGSGGFEDLFGGMFGGGGQGGTRVRYNQQGGAGGGGFEDILGGMFGGGGGGGFRQPRPGVDSGCRRRDRARGRRGHAIERLAERRSQRQGQPRQHGEGSGKRDRIGLRSLGRNRLDRPLPAGRRRRDPEGVAGLGAGTCQRAARERRLTALAEHDHGILARGPGGRAHEGS